MPTLYERRVEQEWRLLQELAELNPEIIQDCVRLKAEGIEVFAFTLRHTQALVEEGEELAVINEHRVSVHFPRFFPSVPMEVSVVRPVFHPNVHAETGFVCLWNRTSSRHTVADAITQLQGVITWVLHNEEPEHVMQPKSLEWYRSAARYVALPVRSRLLRGREGTSVARNVTRKGGVGSSRPEPPLQQRLMR